MSEEQKQVKFSEKLQDRLLNFIDNSSIWILLASVMVVFGPVNVFERVGLWASDGIGYLKKFKAWLVSGGSDAKVYISRKLRIVAYILIGWLLISLIILYFYISLTISYLYEGNGTAIAIVGVSVWFYFLITTRLLLEALVNLVYKVIVTSIDFAEKTINVGKDILGKEDTENISIKESEELKIKLALFKEAQFKKSSRDFRFIPMIIIVISSPLAAFPNISWFMMLAAVAVIGLAIMMPYYWKGIETNFWTKHYKVIMLVLLVIFVIFGSMRYAMPSLYNAIPGLASKVGDNARDGLTVWVYGKDNQGPFSNWFSGIVNAFNKKEKSKAVTPSKKIASNSLVDPNTSATNANAPILLMPPVRQVRRVVISPAPADPKPTPPAVLLDDDPVMKEINAGLRTLGAN